MSNLTAGIGDPYWYEWLVGVNYALDMLSPDTDVAYVTLQASSAQGLDDVIIGYKDGHIKGVQIKHTRADDTLTFNDLIHAEDSEISLLCEIFSDWKSLKKKTMCTTCEAILFTNRKAGNRRSTINKKSTHPVSLPALKKIWPEIKTQIENPKCTTLAEIKIDKNWQEAWALFLSQIKDTDEKVTLEFLKNFSIQADEDDLKGFIEQIREKLSSYFKVDEQITVQMDKSLCLAIREWATTMRQHEQITREDLFEALSIGQDNMMGEHSLPPCSPFFSSRISFVDDIEVKLKSRQYPVVFLEGIPGSGKTNIVSYLATKRFSCIDLRFHAFKPIYPGDKYLQNDQGLSDPCALWGDLLIQLRLLLKGRLAEFDVPISNQILQKYEKMREEVLRIANAYGKNQNRTFVIAIDGIDHAARAGLQNTFLSTLIPPEGVPENVCFLIAGQPLQYYDEYPVWLQNKDLVFHCEVPPIQSEDVIQLLQQNQVALSDCSYGRAAEVIIEKVAGNTLSSVFAVYECKNTSTLDQLVKRIECTSLSSGIQAYYDYIWKESKKIIPGHLWYIDTQIATILSVYTARITAAEMATIFDDNGLSIAVWNRIFRSLYPIVIEEADGYRPLHNDVRVYLQQYIRKNTSEYHECCIQIANHLFSNNGNPRVRHEIGFRLLAEANTLDQTIKYFTHQYVIESIHLKRPAQEILDQLEATIPFFTYQLELEQQLSFACAVETLAQYQATLFEQEKYHISELALPVVLPCEKNVDSQDLFLAGTLENLFQQVEWLIRENELVRAANVMHRWIKDLTPYDLCSIIAKNENDRIDKKFLARKRISGLLARWGEIAYFLDLPVFSYSNDEEQLSIAFWGKGWLCGARKGTPQEFITKWKTGKLIAFGPDLEEMLVFMLKQATEEEVHSFVSQISMDKLSYHTKVYWVCWSIVHNLCEQCEEVLEEILQNELGPLEHNHLYSNEDHTFTCGVLVAFIMRLYNKFENDSFDTFVVTLAEKAKGYTIGPKDRGYASANNLVLAAIVLADILTDINCSKDALQWSNSLDFIVDSVFEERDGIGCSEIGGTSAKRALLSLLILMAQRNPELMEDALCSRIVEKANNANSLILISIWWNYLRSRGENDTLHSIFRKWLSVRKGVAWEKELYETHDIAEIIMPLADNMGWDDEINEVSDMLSSCKIGYLSHKDYSLDKPLDWFNVIDKESLDWQEIGMRFLNISEYASRVGDNRAAIRIQGAIASLIAQHGVATIDAFIKTIVPATMPELQFVLDAIIESFSYLQISNEEILEIWKTVVELLNIDHTCPEYDSENAIRIAYIYDLRIAIKTYLSNHSENNPDEIINAMREYSPFEYEIESGPERITFTLPDRWFYSQYKNSKVLEFIEENANNAVDTIFAKLQGLIEKGDRARWDLAIGFLDLLQEKSVAVTNCVASIFDLSINHRRPDPWEYDGVNRLYERMWPYLDDAQKEVLVSSLHVHYQQCRQVEETGLPNFFYLCNDIHQMILWQAPLLDNSTKINALKIILDMHTNWITSLNKRVYTPRYSCVVEADENATWKDVCQLLKTINE